MKFIVIEKAFEDSSKQTEGTSAQIARTETYYIAESAITAVEVMIMRLLGGGRKLGKDSSIRVNIHVSGMTQPIELLDYPSAPRMQKLLSELSATLGEDLLKGCETAVNIGT